MKKVLVVIAMTMLIIMVSATVNQHETKASFPISSDARGNMVGVTLYASIATGGWVYVEPWMQEPWTEAAFNDEMASRYTPATVRASAFYRFDDGTVECENSLLKPYINEMLNDWIELWENEFDANFVEQVKAASRYWEAVWG